MQMLQFDADSTNINTAAGPVLNEVYEFLKDNPGIVIRVEGHTNNVPPDEYCDKLSTARAKSVAEYVVQQGIAGERVYYKGYGKRQPIYSNQTAEGRRKNQRVEIKILEIGDAGS
jgi:outer membrane protein OmpA-like peptidoglycan-associated protein